MIDNLVCNLVANDVHKVMITFLSTAVYTNIVQKLTNQQEFMTHRKYSEHIHCVSKKPAPLRQVGIYSSK